MQTALALLLVCGGAAARAEGPALHDIPWYKAHTAAREATLRWCHDSAERGRMADCQNAERAAAAAMFKNSKRDPLSFLNSPEYYAVTPMARYMVLGACAHPEIPGNRSQLPYCAAARAGAAMAGQH